MLCGCASTPDSSSLAPVPVYAEDEILCEYEVMERVRIRSPRSADSEADLIRQLLDAYGRAGAAVGADAVIAEIPSTSGRARRREIGRAFPIPTGPPPGRAIRFIPGTCERA